MHAKKRRFIRFIKTIWAGGNQSTRNPFTVGTAILGVTYLPFYLKRQWSAKTSCWKSPIEQKPKSTWEAGAEPLPSALLPGLVKRNVYVGLFTRNLKKTHPIKRKQTAQHWNTRNSRKVIKCQLFQRPGMLHFSAHSGSFETSHHLPFKNQPKRWRQKAEKHHFEWWGGSIPAMPCGAQPWCDSQHCCTAWSKHQRWGSHWLLIFF